MTAHFGRRQTYEILRKLATRDDGGGAAAAYTQLFRIHNSSLESDAVPRAVRAIHISRTSIKDYYYYLAHCADRKEEEDHWTKDEEDKEE